MNTIIVAYDRHRVIGKDGDIPWLGQLPIDMKFFRDSTIGKTVIMGRKTYDSLPEAFRPLPGRENIVLSLSMVAINGVIIAHDIQEALGAASEEPYIIGGASIYEQAMPFAGRILATEVHTDVSGGDVFFPEIPDDVWQETARLPFEADERNRYSGAFVTYLRQNK